MSAAIGQSERKVEDLSAQLSVRDLVLLRISAAPRRGPTCSVTWLRFSRPGLPGCRVSPFSRAWDSTLTGNQLVTEVEGPSDSRRPKGFRLQKLFFFAAKTPCATWQDVKTALVIRALQTHDTPAIRKALQRVEGLAALVLQHHFDMPTARAHLPPTFAPTSPSSHSNGLSETKSRRDFGKGAGLPAKAGPDPCRATLQATTRNRQRRQADRASCL